MLSEYAKKEESNVEKRCIEKIFETRINPVLIPSQKFNWSKMFTPPAAIRINSSDPSGVYRI